MYRDNTTAFGTASGGYGKIGAQSPEIVIQHYSGSYKYVNGVWWKRRVIIGDSVYTKVSDTTTIPKEVLNKIK